MKKKYIAPDAQYVSFQLEDEITASLDIENFVYDSDTINPETGLSEVEGTNPFKNK